MPEPETTLAGKVAALHAWLSTHLDTDADLEATLRTVLFRLSVMTGDQPSPAAVAHAAAIKGGHALAVHRTGYTTVQITGMSTAIIRAAAKAWAVTPAKLLGPDRHRQVVHGRAAAAWAMYTGLGLGHGNIAALLRRDRSTIVYAIKNAEALREHDPNFRAGCDTVLEAVAAGQNAKSRPAAQ